MEAVIKVDGKQYQVSKGQKLKVSLANVEQGKELSFDALALLDDKSTFGTPIVKGAKVVAKVLDQSKGKKVIVTKYKRRKGYLKTQGHRQLLTELEITDIKKS